MRQYIVGYSHKGVFFYKHLAVFHYNGQTVDVGVDNESYIGTAFAHEVGNLCEVFRDWLRGMGKLSVGLAVEFYDIFYAKSTQQLGYDDTSDGVYRVDSYGEVGIADGFGIHEFEIEHFLNVAACICVVFIYVSEIFDCCKCVVVIGGVFKHFLSLLGVEEFAVFVE